MKLFEYIYEKELAGGLQMTQYQDHFHPPSSRQAIDITTMTVKELGDVAEAQGVTLLHILTL